MRALVLALALLAALKIWIQDSVYRSATEEALLAAYLGRAAEACAGASGPAPTAPAGAVDWSAAAEPRVAVGNPAIPVHLWEFDDALWNARYRQPYLVLEAATGGLTCTYDILGAAAEITRS